MKIFSFLLLFSLYLLFVYLFITLDSSILLSFFIYLLCEILVRGDYVDNEDYVSLRFALFVFLNNGILTLRLFVFLPLMTSLSTFSFSLSTNYGHFLS